VVLALGEIQRRDNTYYVWLVVHKESRQVIAFHVGDRSRESVRKLWAKIPAHIRQHGLFHTDDWEAYKGVIPEERHLYSKKKKWTNHVERLNCTLRQRVSRLVRETLSFSKDLNNHIGAIQYFLCHHNLTLQTKLTAPLFVTLPNKVTHIITSSFFTVFYTLPSKSRMDCLRALQGNPVSPQARKLMRGEDINAAFQQAGICSAERREVIELLQRKGEAILNTNEFEELLRVQAAHLV